MAVQKMQSVTLCALKQDRKAILEQMQLMGVVEVHELEADDSGLEKMDVATAKMMFEKNMNLAEQALGIIAQYAPEKKGMLSSLEGKKNMSIDEFEAKIAKRDDIIGICNDVVAEAKGIAEAKAAKVKPINQIEGLKPWMSLDVPMSIDDTENVSFLIGTLPENRTLDDIYAGIAAENDELSAFDVEIISSSEDQTCVFITCEKDQKNTLFEALRGIGFIAVEGLCRGVPEQAVKVFQEEIQKLDEQIEKAAEKIVKLADHRREIEFVSDYFSMRADKYEILGGLSQTKNTFFISGYIQERHAEKFAKVMQSKYDVVIEFEEAKGDDVPVALKNGGFSSPLEPVVESFSLPGKGEIDPTSIMSIFYYIFFGMMLADAAYGFLMFAVCGILLLKFKNMSDGMHKTLKMFMFCGLSTLFWGVMYGGYFGDIIPVIGKTYFGVDIVIKPLWFNPVEDPMKMMLYSFLFGLIHLFVGLAIKGYQQIKAKEFKDFICDVVLWFVLLFGLIGLLLPSSLFTAIGGLAEPIKMPAWLIEVAKWASIVSAVGIVLTSGRESRSWGKRLMKGLYGLYGVSGWLSDVLSYSRLLALGLASGIIATVINQMGSMLGNSVLSAIIFAVIFVVGHALNLAINLLGAYVHTNRLQYYEFFAKFYDGGGRKFSPFQSNTKYYKIQEETK